MVVLSVEGKQNIVALKTQLLSHLLDTQLNNYTQLHTAYTVHTLYTCIVHVYTVQLTRNLTIVALVLGSDNTFCYEGLGYHLGVKQESLIEHYEYNINKYILSIRHDKITSSRTYAARAIH